MRIVFSLLMDIVKKDKSNTSVLGVYESIFVTFPQL